MSFDNLLSPTQLGDISIKNRVLMAPMTRSRANIDGTANELMQTYYAQRASAGLIITEGTQPSANGQGYCRTPGIYTDDHVKSWQAVTSEVAQHGGAMVMQIMHCGRIASRYNKADQAETVAPSAIQAKGQIYTDTHGMTDFDVPRALSLSEIADVIDEYRTAATRAIDAGFEGIELHATSGYLPAQFLSTGTNHRSDRYGGNVGNRVRFVEEVLLAMCEAVGAGKVGLRICPGNPFNDLQDENVAETFTTLLAKVNPMHLAYLHVIRMPEKITGVDNIALAMDNFDGPLVVNDSYEFDEAEKIIAEGKVAAVSFARHFIANPELPRKIQSGDQLKTFDPKTLYTAGSAGYTDY